MARKQPGLMCTCVQKLNLHVKMKKTILVIGSRIVPHETCISLHWLACPVWPPPCKSMQVNASQTCTDLHRFASRLAMPLRWDIRVIYALLYVHRSECRSLETHGEYLSIGCKGTTSEGILVIIRSMSFFQLLKIVDFVMWWIQTLLIHDV